MTTLVSSKILFLDSDNNIINGVGDNFQVDLPSYALSVGDRQFNRISVIDFHM